MTKLEKKGKGIILMHDFQHATANAMPDLLNELKAKGYKVVHMKAKAPLTTLAQWDDAAKKEVKSAGIGPTGRRRASCARSRTRRRRSPQPRRPRQRGEEIERPPRPSRTAARDDSA